VEEYKVAELEFFGKLNIGLLNMVNCKVYFAIFVTFVPEKL